MKQFVMMAGAAIVVGVALGAWGQAASAPTTTRAAATSASAPASGPSAEGKAVLALPVQAIDMTGVTLAGFLNDTGMWVNATIEVDWASLKAAGLDEERPLTFQLHDVTLEDVLKVICAQEAQGKTGVEMKYRMEGTVVKLYAVKAAGK